MTKKGQILFKIELEDWRWNPFSSKVETTSLVYHSLASSHSSIPSIFLSFNRAEAVCVSWRPFTPKHRRLIWTLHGLPSEHLEHLKCIRARNPKHRWVRLGLVPTFQGMSFGATGIGCRKWYRAHQFGTGRVGWFSWCKSGIHELMSVGT